MRLQAHLANADSAFKELSANLVGDTRLVAAGIVAVNVAQLSRPSVSD
jgi:hypothetical protein